MGRLRLFPLVPLLVLVASGAGITANVPTERPAWSKDLRTLGYPGHLSENFSQTFGVPPTKLAFADREHLVVTFISADPHAPHEQEGKPGSFRLRLHVIVFESKTGDVDAKSDWATPDPGDGVIAAYNGKVVIRSAHKLTLYNTKLEALKETDMAPAFVALSSLTGHFLLLGSSKSHDAEQSREFSWMNAETLETVHSFSDALSPVSISDTEIGLWRRLRPPEVEFVIRKPDEPGRVITVPGHGWLRVVFVDQDTLATEAGYFPITLVRTDGTLVETVTPNTHGLFSRVTPSAEGHRFAFTGSIIRNRSEIFSPNRPWEYVQRIHVYDMSTHSFVGDVKVHHSAKDQEFPLALSPNGSMLAFLDGKSLTVYRLP